MHRFRQLLFALGTLALAFAVGVAPAAAAGGSSTAAARLKVSPSSVRAGHPVTVSGSLGSGCPVGDQVIITSQAFVHTQDFAGVPAVFATVKPGGTYSVTTTIPVSKAPGSYRIGGRCGGGNLGVSVALLVRRPSRLPFTGIPVLPELAIGFGLVGLGSLLAFSRIRRNRSAGRA